MTTILLMEEILHRLRLVVYPIICKVIYIYTSRVGVCDFFQSAIYVRRSYHVNFEGHVLQVGSLGAMMGTSKGSVKQVCETGGVEG